jgi:hypothetical protein
MPYNLLTLLPVKNFYTFEFANAYIMIQRSQSVYLLLVTALMSLMLFRPYAEIILADGQTLAFRSHEITIKGVAGNPAYKSTIPIMAVVGVTGLLSFFTIFLYNRRLLQMRICMINMVLLSLLLIIMYVYYSSAKHVFNVTLHSFRFPAIFPLMSIIFSFMAYRNIHRDEMLVSSYNRLR